MKKHTLIFITVLFSGCSPYKRGFNCHVPEGTPCTSMTRIHELIDEGFFTQQPTSKANCKGCTQSVDDQDWVEAVIMQDEGRTDEPAFRKYVLSGQKK